MLYCFILLRKWSDSRINTVIYPSHFSAFYTPIHDRPCRPLTTRLPLTILPSPYPAPPLSSLLPTLPLDPSHYSQTTLTPLTTPPHQSPYTSSHHSSPLPLPHHSSSTLPLAYPTTILHLTTPLIVILIKSSRPTVTWRGSKNPGRACKRCAWWNLSH